MPENTKSWTAGQLKVIEWLALPKSARKPKTQTLLAADVGVHETTISDWKKIPGFLDEVTARARFQLKDSMTDIYAALVKAATAGDVPAIKLAMEMSGEYTPKQKIDMDLSKLSDDELERIASGQGGGIT